MPRRFRRVALSGIVLVIAGCGSGAAPGITSGATDTTSSPSAASASPAPTATPTPPTATPAPPPLVWIAHHASGMLEIRVVNAPGVAHVVATLSSDVQVLAAGHGRVVAVDPDHTTFRVVDLGTGTTTTFSVTGGGSGETILGGAISPDGTRFAYVDAVFGASHERIIDLTSHAIITVRAVPDNNLDSPTVWAPVAVGAVTLVGFSDAGPQAVQQLDPATLNRVHSTPASGVCQIMVSDEATRAADTMHSALGDEADAPPGPGPPRPCNTLRSYTIGGTPAAVLSEAHHQLTMVAVSGSGICFADDPAAGAFAGASLHTDLGLFLLSGTGRQQLAHWDGGIWSGGLLIGSDVIAIHGQMDGTGSLTLERFDSSGTEQPLDSLPDGTSDLVAVA